MLRDLPERLEEFTEKFEDDGVLASRDRPANTSHDSDSERPTKVAPRKHRTFTHFAKDRDCEVCERTEIAGAPGRKRTGDRITADHKVLSEGCVIRKKKIRTRGTRYMHSTDTILFV